MAFSGIPFPEQLASLIVINSQQALEAQKSFIDQWLTEAKVGRFVLKTDQGGKLCGG
jgi:hypothetical protein